MNQTESNRVAHLDPWRVRWLGVGWREKVSRGDDYDKNDYCIKGRFFE
jgi:hypothetical protein